MADELIYLDLYEPDPVSLDLEVQGPIYIHMSTSEANANTLIKGDTGEAGADGVDAVAGKIPNNYVQQTSNQTTTSATLEDMPNMTVDITTEETVEIVGLMTFSAYTTGGAPSTAAFAISINGVDGQEVQRYLSGINDRGVGAVQFQSAALSAGTYTVKARWRRVSGSSTINCDLAQLSTHALQGAINATGVTFLTGAKSSAVDAGTEGQLSITNDYIYFCVQTGGAGSAIWKKALVFIST